MELATPEEREEILRKKDETRRFFDDMESNIFAKIKFANAMAPNNHDGLNVDSSRQENNDDLNYGINDDSDHSSDDSTNVHGFDSSSSISDDGDDGDDGNDVKKRSSSNRNDEGYRVRTLGTLSSSDGT